jgi:small-conductance mechanosensitive channel
MYIKPAQIASVLNQWPPAQPQPPLSGGQVTGRSSNLLYEHQKKRLQDMQTSIVKMQELHRNSSPKKRASQRAALLKQRLEMLKSMMSRLPPGDYKTLAQELKTIARELKALSSQLGKSGNTAPSPSLPTGFATDFTQDGQGSTLVDTPDMGGAPMAFDATNPEQPAASIDASLISATPLDAKVDADSVEEQESASAATTPFGANSINTDVQHAGKASGQHPINQQKDDDIDAKQLRDILNKAKKLLKEVLSQLKAKHQPKDEETRRLFGAIERDLAKLEQALEQGNLSLSLPESAAEAGADIDTASLGEFMNIRV